MVTTLLLTDQIIACNAVQQPRRAVSARRSPEAHQEVALRNFKGQRVWPWMLTELCWWSTPGTTDFKNVLRELFA